MTCWRPWLAPAALAATCLLGTTAQADPGAGSKASYQTATGTLASYDAATRTLTVHSAGGSQAFRVAPDARLWLGSHRLPIGQLSARAGAQVTVAWSDVDGVRTTHTVRVNGARAAGGW